MNLPEKQECVHCHIVRPASDFQLSRGGARGGKNKLSPICRHCQKKVLIANKKLRVAPIRIGERPLSDRLIQKLQQQNNQKMDLVIDGLLNLVSSNSEMMKLAAIRTIIDLTQSRAPVFRVPEKVTEHMFDVGDQPEPETQTHSVDDLLSLVPNRAAANNS